MVRSTFTIIVLSMVGVTSATPAVCGDPEIAHSNGYECFGTLVDIACSVTCDYGYSTSTNTTFDIICSTGEIWPTSLPTCIALNDDCANAQSINYGQNNGTTFGTCLDCTSRTCLFCPISYPSCQTTVSSPPQDVWYSFNGTGAAVTANTCNPLTDYDTQLTVYSGAEDCLDLTCITSNDDSCLCSNNSRSQVQWSTVPGLFYLIQVHGYQSDSGTFQLSFGVCGDPGIVCGDPGICLVCEDPGIAHSNGDECADTAYGMTCSVTCDNGYSTGTTSTFDITCSTGGFWHNRLPTCIATPCGDPPVITNGYASAGCNDTEVGSSCTVSCAADYTMSGGNPTGPTCQLGGGWDGVPTCSPISLLVATEDAFIRGGSYADDNYGGKGKLKIKGAAQGRYNRIAFVQFDISPVRFSSFISISLKLCTKRNDDVNSNSVTIHIGNCAESINEATLTWNTQPTTGDAICSNVPVGAVGSCIECNVITYVEESCPDATEIYFVIIDDFPSFVEFYSKDFGDPPLHPVLVVTSPVNSNLDNQINITEAGTDHEQNGWPVNEAKDGILTGSDNGWAFSGIVPATAWFAFDKQYSIHKVTLLCDYNVNDHHITEFTLQYTTVIPPSQHSAWTNVPSPFFFGPFFTASIIDDHFKLSGQYEVVVGFSDVEATGLLLKVFDSDADNQNAVLTEILVYSSQPAGSSDAFANLAGSALDMSSSATLNGQFPTSSANVDPQFPELQGGNSNGPQDGTDNPTGHSNGLVNADANELPAQNDITNSGTNEPPDSNEPQDSGRNSKEVQNLE